MDNARNPDPLQDDSWIDDILSPPELGDEIGPDEQAVAAAGLRHPDDLELDKIIAETKAADWEMAPAQVPAPEPFRDEEYRDTFGEGQELKQFFDDPPVTAEAPSPSEAPESEEIEEEPPMRKGRPKRKKGYGLLGIPHILATAVWLVIIVAIGVSLGRTVWVCAADMLAFGRENKEITITITDSDDIDAVANKLKSAGLIRYPEFFKFFVQLTGKDSRISVGTFTLNSLYDYSALVNGMSAQAPGREVVEVVIPEGYTCAQIFNLLESNGVCTVAQLEEYAANGELDDYWFLEGVERGDRYCLEGYLFPDTYQFYTNDDPERVLEKFLNDFEYRFTDLMLERLTTLNEQLSEKMAKNGYGQDYIDAHQMTIREVVIVASMIEKETAGSSESYTISSVIYNRLTNPNFPFLNIDATIVYALGGKTDALTYEDLQIDSPYNSYTNPGLIPGPISNPGRDSLNAALVPEETSYYYYALDPSTGQHHFSKTEKEHTAFLSSISSGD